ncbi:MAG TPA: glucoamylase family protein [Planctomycetota bacterium]|nr:glucoamylase family protein [Planctomycetota bacterium]
MGARRDTLRSAVDWVHRHPTLVYVGSLGLLTAAITAAIVLASAWTGLGWIPTLLLSLFSLLPASQLAVQALNYAVTRLLPPVRLPRLSFQNGIPTAFRTLVVVPVIPRSVEEVDDEVGRLEVRYLANTDPNLAFGLLPDFADAPEERMPDDECLLAREIEAIESLNQRYGKDRFFLVHRPRSWSESEQTWMGRERKRGKIEELNRLLCGDTAPELRSMIHVGSPELFVGVRFVITLDADTLTPPGTARRLVETLAHPLNRPRLSKDGRVVTSGYSVIQPRVATSLPSANATLFSTLFAGPSGTDPYSDVVSEVYQDLVREGSYHGKGIYDVRMFHDVLTGRFPVATLLSHDLIEGAHVRVGHASDIELFDLFPASYAAYAARQHRWIRGDWQIAAWIFPRVPAADGSRVPNPLPPFNRWKLLDNLRRSLMPVFMMALLLVSWALPPPAALLGVLLVGLTRFFPAILPFISWAASPLRCRVAWGDILRTVARILFLLSLLPHQALVALDAIARVVYRKLISRRDLLEWQTAQAAHLSALKRDRRFLVKLSLACLGASLAGGLVLALHPASLGMGLPFVVLWLLGPVAGLLLRATPRKERVMEPEDLKFLRTTARLTWRYFDDFVGPSTNWLPPDNFQEALKVEVAMRTSPTNMGLWLLSCLSARDLGYVTFEDFLERSLATFKRMALLERHEGHLLNWYDIEKLEPLRPRYVSAVDSGNLLACLYAFDRGVEDSLSDPVLSGEALRGLGDSLGILESSLVSGPGRAGRHARLISSLKEVLDPVPANLLDLMGRIAAAARLLEAQSEPEEDPSLEGDETRYWLEKLQAQAAAWSETSSGLLGWIPILHDAPPEAVSSLGAELEALQKRWRVEAPSIALLEGGADARNLERFIEGSLASASPVGVKPWLERLSDALKSARERAAKVARSARSLLEHSTALSSGMNLAFVYDEEKRLFVIGVDLSEMRRDGSHYDLLASEARLASFVAIAKGDVPVEHWLAIGRPMGIVDGQRVLLSWTGSMFEYLMPLLLQRAEKGSLLEYACRAAVKRQIAYGNKRGIPWGISESAYSGIDWHRTYQYRAFGVPGLGLKRGLEKDLVVAPYSTALALLVDRQASIENLRRLARAGLCGRRGFYEAIDYGRQADREAGTRGVIVYAYLAHHQGMSLIALDNVIHRDIHRSRFHSDARVRAVEPLLFERVPRAPAFLAPPVEEKSLLRLTPFISAPALSRVNTPFTPVPRAHLLSNGTYSLMVTNSGGGYSRWRGIDITRWRADTTRDMWGAFAYVRDLDSGATWSTAYQPVRRLGKQYEVSFTADRAEFRRRDGQVRTETEVIVSPEDDVEVRRIVLSNASRTRRVLEVTSYSELALATQAADRAHPAFSKLFVATEALPWARTLIATRRTRSPEEPRVFAAHLISRRASAVEPFEFETDRARFLGRGRTQENPIALERPLEGTVGDVLDPAFSIRRRVELDSGEKTVLYLVTAAADSREKIIGLVEKYSHPEVCDGAFERAWIYSQLELRFLGINPQDGHRFQQLASHILFPSAALRPPAQRLRSSILDKRRLWAHGISGDLPILSVTLGEFNDLELVRELLLAQAFWRQRGLKVDLVILDTEPAGYAQPLRQQLDKIIHAHTSRAGSSSPGGVFLVSGGQLSGDDLNLIHAVSAASLVAARGPLAQQLAPFTEGPEEPPPLQIRDTASEYPSRPLAETRLRYSNGLGGFSESGREYVIELQRGAETPAPWSNVLANASFGALVSESGSGFAWQGNSQMNRLLPWSNDPVLDPPGEGIYIRDEDSGEYWTPTPLPVHETEPYRVRHGHGYTVFEHNSHGIEQELTVFVPVDDEGGAPVRIQRLRLRNLSDRRRRLTVTAYLEWVCGTCREETQLHLFTSWDPESGAILARNAHQPDFGGYVAFAALYPRATSFTGDRTEFLGPRGSPARPAALDRVNLSGRTEAGIDPASALQVDIQLERGESATVIHLLGQAPDLHRARELVKKLRGPRDVDAALERTKAWWDGLLGNVKVKTPEASLNFLLNRWLLYQTLACRIWGRSAFYQSGGAYGFRDQLQDVLALIHTAPAIAREHILRASSRQFVEGDVQHWWHPPAGGGVRGRCSDDLLWLPYAVVHYVRVTGDASILDVRTPFLDGRALEPTEHEIYLMPSTSLDDDTIMEHCRRALERGFDLGLNGLPKIGTGDWNDGFNRVGAEGKGESVWLAWFLMDVLHGFAELCDLKALSPLAVRCRQNAEQLSRAVEAKAWDGEWYVRAFHDDGTVIGSKDSPEAKIDSLPQSWSVISGAADPERAESAMRSVEKHLVKERERLVLLFTPPFEKPARDPGYVRGYPPGVRENGGQYTHAAIWVAMALARKGDGDGAVRILSLLNPIERAQTAANARRYRVEPYVVAADIYALPGRVGMGGWTWYTGSSGWMYRVWLEEVLGFKRRGRTLEITPSIAASWPGYSITLRQGTTTYEISVENPRSVCRGVEWIEIDGEPATPGPFTLEDDGRKHHVRVRMGTPPPGALSEKERVMESGTELADAPQTS